MLDSLVKLQVDLITILHKSKYHIGLCRYRENDGIFTSPDD